MRLVTQATALLETVTASDLSALSPVERRRFADRCRHLADIAERFDAPKSGVLADLRQRQT